MTTFVTRCRQCGAEFEPDRRAIVAATWRLCPACQPQPATRPAASDVDASCGRNRTLCLGCAMGASAL